MPARSTHAWKASCFAHPGTSPALRPSLRVDSQCAASLMVADRCQFGFDSWLSCASLGTKRSGDHRSRCYSPASWALCGSNSTRTACWKGDWHWPYDFWRSNWTTSGWLAYYSHSLTTQLSGYTCARYSASSASSYDLYYYLPVDLQAVGKSCYERSYWTFGPGCRGQLPKTGSVAMMALLSFWWLLLIRLLDSGHSLWCPLHLDKTPWVADSSSCQQRQCFVYCFLWTLSCPSCLST